MSFKTSLIFLLALFSLSSFAKLNLHIIDENPETGFAIYRSSKPDAKGMRKLCDQGITEMMVMSGNASEYEDYFAAECPTLKVTFNKQMKAKVPMSASFLREFDAWVKDAKEKGKRIAFRCNCGCHRTGRVAAYYQMKYQRLSAVDAKIIMKKHGKFMWLFPYLKPQVDALKDYILGRECSTKKKYCVRDL